MPKESFSPPIRNLWAGILTKDDKKEIVMTTVIAISDIHGQMGVFPRLTAMQARYPGAITVFDGDYVDGLDGFAAVHRIWEMQRAEPDRTIVLKGNHDCEMLKYFTMSGEDYWLDIGGHETLENAAQDLGINWDDGDRQVVFDAHWEMVKWLWNRPLDYSVGKLQFVHAGFDLTLSKPVEETSRYQKLWIRGGYLYGPHSDGVFAHNPLSKTIVTGHTPTGYFGGFYDHGTHPPKYSDPAHSPVYRVAYPGEQPRYFIDGGIGPNDLTRCGNVAVFDSDTGMLIDVLEDN
jgi:serine/threonine protein phosphatase 1